MIPQAWRDRGAIGKKQDLLHGLERMRAEMRTLDDAVKAETVGASHQVEVVSQVLNRVARRMLAANDQAEFHRPDVTPLCPSRPVRRARPLIRRLMSNMTIAPLRPQASKSLLALTRAVEQRTGALLEHVPHREERPASSGRANPGRRGDSRTATRVSAPTGAPAAQRYRRLSLRRTASSAGKGVLGPA